MKIARSDKHGSVKVVLHDDGSWKMTWTGASPKPAPERALPSSRPPSVLLRHMIDLLGAASSPTLADLAADILKTKPQKTPLEVLIEQLRRQRRPK
jgi:hypothetical protein